MKPAPVHVEAILYMGIAVFGFLQIELSSDEAGKYIGLCMLFFTKMINGALLAAFTALKTFRSQSFADYVKKKNGNGDSGNTTVFVKTNEPPKQ